MDRKLKEINKKCIVVVLDGLGIGAMDDVEATRPQDIGANTLKSIIDHACTLRIPNLKELGLLDSMNFTKEQEDKKESAYSRIRFAHYGADTFYGHQEIMGSEPIKPMQQKFNDLIQPIEESLIKNGYQVRRVGEKRQQILVVNEVMSVADNIECDLGSAFNITGSLDDVSFEEVIKVGKIVRALVKTPRVIAFAGRGVTIHNIVSAIEIKGDYVGVNAPRSGVYREDYHCVHLGYGIDANRQIPTLLKQNKIPTYLIGKVADIVENEKENTFSLVPTEAVMKKILELMDHEKGFICANVQETDLSGHSQDVERYASVLNCVDSYLPKIIEKMKEEDRLLIIADHGNDPMIGHSKHTREYVPLLVYGKNSKLKGKFEQQNSLANVGATVCKYFNCPYDLFGKAFEI